MDAIKVSIPVDIPLSCQSSGRTQGSGMFGLVLVLLFRLSSFTRSTTAEGKQCNIQHTPNSNYTRSSYSCPSKQEVPTSADPLQASVKKVFVKVNQEIHLNCASCSKPLTDIQWFRNRFEFATANMNANGTGRNECDDSQSLVFRSFTCGDQGDYSCSALCNGRSVKESCQAVRVEGDLCTPRVADPEKAENVVEGKKGSRLILTCGMVYASVWSNSLILHSRWYRGRVAGGGWLLRPFWLCGGDNCCSKNYSSRRHWKGNIQVVNLTIEILTEEDEGWYTCAAYSVTSTEAYVYYYVRVTEEDHQSLWTLYGIPVTISMIAGLTLTVPALIVIVIRQKRTQARCDNVRVSRPRPRPPPSCRFVYISYAEDSPTHLSKVKSMASRLSRSFDCRFYEEYSNEAANMFLHNWLSQQIGQSTCIIIVCSPRYRELTERMQQNGSQLSLQENHEFINWEQRVLYEWHLIQSRCFALRQQLASFCLAVLWDASDETAVPFPLAGNTRFRWPREMRELSEYLENELRTQQTDVAEVSENRNCHAVQETEV